MIEVTCVVTAAPQDRRMHVLHRTDCQGLPTHMELLEVGGFAGCRGAMPAAREGVGPVQGCSPCCPDCRA